MSDHADLSTDLQDKSADHGIEVKGLDTATDTATDADVVDDEPAESPTPTTPAEDPTPIEETVAETIGDADTVEVEFIHHYREYVPGATVPLDARLAASLIASRAAKKV